MVTHISIAGKTDLGILMGPVPRGAAAVQVIFSRGQNVFAHNFWVMPRVPVLL